MSRLAFGPALLVSALIGYSCVSLDGPDPTASIRPTIGAASASPRPTRSPTRQSDAATPAQASPPSNPTFASDAAVARLLSGFATGLIPYHLRYESVTTLFEGVVSVDGSTLIADIDVSTPDFAGHFFDSLRRTDIVSLHGVVYTSDASGEWTRSSSDGDYFYLNPFDWMNEPDVRDLGSVFRIRTATSTPVGNVVPRNVDVHR